MHMIEDSAQIRGSAAKSGNEVDESMISYTFIMIVSYSIWQAQQILGWVKAKVICIYRSCKELPAKPASVIT